MEKIHIYIHKKTSLHHYYDGRMEPQKLKKRKEILI